jgi:murein L,D-transpeptidase YcbB/YkuD
MSKRSLIITILIAVLLILPCHVAVAESGLAAIVADHLRERILPGRVPSQIFCRQEFLCGSSILPRFYTERNFRPGWIDDTGLSFQAESLINMIREAHLEGLSPKDYHLATILSLVHRSRTIRNWNVHSELLVDLDMLLTDAFFIYATHLLTGRVDPETIHTKWIAYTRDADLVQLLTTALATHSVEPTLKYFRPPYSGYYRLRTALKHYRDIASRGGWQPLPTGRKMRKGSVDKRLSILRHHLVLTGDLSPVYRTDNLFDDVLEDAVRRYQKRHGLVADGVVGPDTLAHLNVPIDEWILKIKLNLERWRWLPHDLERSYININIADFRLDVIEQERSALNMKVVVGSNYRRTPVFSGTMNYIVINPYWNIPTKLVKKDIYPRIRKDRHYLEKRNIRVFENWNEDAPEIDPEHIDWSRLDRGTFYYKLRQDSGPMNPLGQIKFMLPNKFAVYLHDTPHKGLFNMTSRGFSAGCIRIENPIGLAAYLLQDYSEWTHEKIENIIETGERHVVHLPREFPVHVLYWTAWVDRDGMINFRDDIYERDGILSDALLENPPAH